MTLNDVKNFDSWIKILAWSGQQHDSSDISNSNGTLPGDFGQEMSNEVWNRRVHAYTGRSWKQTAPGVSGSEYIIPFRITYVSSQLLSPQPHLHTSRRRRR